MSTYAVRGRHLRARNGCVDALEHLIINQRQSSTSICDSAASSHLMADAIHIVNRRRELPEPVVVVDRSIIDRTSSRLDDILIDVPKGVERLAFVRIVGIFPATKVASEQLG